MSMGEAGEAGRAGKAETRRRTEERRRRGGEASDENVRKKINSTAHALFTAGAHALAPLLRRSGAQTLARTALAIAASRAAPAPETKIASC